MPGVGAHTSAPVLLSECRIIAFDVFDVDCTERRLRLLHGRVSLNLNELILEITARKGGDGLVALLWRILIVSNSDNVHYNTRICESDFGPHVRGNARRGM